MQTMTWAPLYLILRQKKNRLKTEVKKSDLLSWKSVHPCHVLKSYCSKLALGEGLSQLW